MKRLLEILISILAGMLLLYVKLGAGEILKDKYTTRGLAVATGGLFATVTYYIKKYRQKKK